MQHVGAVLSLLFLFSDPALGATGPDIDSQLLRIFPETSRIEEKTLWLDAAAREHVRRAGRTSFDEDHLSYRTISGKAGIVGYAFVDDVKGLHEMITYMTALNADGSVRAVEILAYREAYGFEIKHDRFRRQFTGKTLKDPIRVGADIRNIAGATISTNAISTGVRKILALYEAGLRERVEGKGDRRTRILWGTALTIDVRGTDTGKTADAIESAFSEVERLTPVFSRYDTSSEISKINRLGRGTSAEVSDDFYDLCRLSLDMVKQTHAAFAPLRPPDLIRGREFFVIPGKDRTAGGARRIWIDTDVQLDFDGIAKGYAVDRIVDILRRHGIQTALVNFGESSIAAMGAPAGSAGWIVQIRDARKPRGPATAALATLVLKDEVLSVSGMYERGPHIIDPFTGKPPPDSLQAVVAGPLDTWANARADALSTALFVSGQNGFDFVQEAGFEGLWLGKFGVIRTEGVRRYEKTQ